MCGLDKSFKCDIINKKEETTVNHDLWNKPLEDIYQDFAEALGKTVEELSSAERQQAYLNYTLNEANGRYMTSLLSDYRLLLTEYEEATAKLREQLDAIDDVYQPRIRALEKQIKDRVLDLEKTSKGSGITVKFRKGYFRSGWDNKALVAYAETHPEVGEFRKVTWIKPNATIKVEE